MVLECLERFRGGEAIPADEGRDVLALLRRQPELIDEFTIQPLLISIRGLPGDPWEIVDDLAQELERRSHGYEVRLVRLAALRRLAEQRDRERGPDLLEAELEQAWREPERDRRHRVVTRLAQLVPAFGMRERGWACCRRSTAGPRSRSARGSSSGTRSCWPPPCPPPSWATAARRPS